jgi:Flp pilus assembly protein TadG
MSPFYRSARGKLIVNDSGQAMVEFAFILPMLLILLCAAIDFGRVFYTLQVIAQLTRQGSNLASRDDTCSDGASLSAPMNTLTCSVEALMAGQSGLNIGTYGEVIISAVENTGTTASPTYTITGQYSKGGLSNASKIGTWTGSNTPATLPPAFGTSAGETPLQKNSTMYVTEIFYTFTAITPIGTLTQNWPAHGTGVSLPKLLYNVGYF